MSTSYLSIKNIWKKEAESETSISSSLALSPLIQLYTAENIDQLNWQNTQDGESARHYLTALIKQGTRHYIDNIDAEMQILQIDKLIFPLLIVHNNYQNSYVCSPYGYLSLGLEELHLIKNRFFRTIAEKAIKGLQSLLRKGKINQLVYVNNWLFSTDLYPPELTIKHLQWITNFLKAKFPDHAIVFRSLNKGTTGKLKRDLKQCGFKFIANRQVYITNPTDQALFKTRIVKSDLKLWHEKEYELIEKEQLSEEDEKRILDLYRHLSIEQHSSLNPKLNERFIKLMLKDPLFQVKALKKDGTIDGVTGYFNLHKTFICPFFGYDKNQKEPNRLYRLLSTTLLLEASKQSHTFHQSAGASFYKTIRRAKSYLEYHGAYTRHLPLRQRSSWWLIKTILNTAAIPLMKKY